MESGVIGLKWLLRSRIGVIVVLFEDVLGVGFLKGFGNVYFGLNLLDIL